jgi:hypothetical protein
MQNEKIIEWLQTLSPLYLKIIKEYADKDLVRFDERIMLNADISGDRGSEINFKLTGKKTVVFMKEGRTFALRENLPYRIASVLDIAFNYGLYKTVSDTVINQHGLKVREEVFRIPEETVTLISMIQL